LGVSKEIFKAFYEEDPEVGLVARSRAIDEPQEGRFDEDQIII